MKVSVCQEIKGSPEQVFAAASDFERASEWVAAITQIEMLSEGPVGVGTRFRETRVMFKREASEEMTVSEFIPGRAYTLTSVSCGAEYKSRFTFRSQGDKTMVNVLFKTQPHSLFAKLTAPLSLLMRGTMRGCLQDDLEALRARMEGSTPTPLSYAGAPA